MLAICKYGGLFTIPFSSYIYGIIIENTYILILTDCFLPHLHPIAVEIQIGNTLIQVIYEMPVDVRLIWLRIGLVGAVTGICCSKCRHIGIISKKNIFHLAGFIQNADYIGL